MHRFAKTLTINLLLVGVSIVLVLGATEIFLRAFPRYLPPLARVKLHWLNLPATVSRADPYTGFRYPPNYHGRVRAGDVDFAYTTDAQGFRNPTPCGSPDSADIVLIGDSEVFGFGVDDRFTWTSLLAQQLRHTCLVNLGLPGMAPKQYLRVYQVHGKPLHPKLVIFGLFPGNDLGDERLFNRWIAAGSPGNYERWRMLDPRSSGLKGKLKGLMEHSYLVWFVKETRHRIRSRLGPTPAPVEFPDGSRINLDPAEFGSQVRMANPADSTFQSVMGDIEEAQALAARGGAGFLVILLATKEGVYLPLRGEAPPPMLPTFRTALEQAQIPFLDLSVPMKEATRRDDKPLFFKVDGHPNAEGYRVIAAAVLAELRRHAAEYGIPDLQ